MDDMVKGKILDLKWTDTVTSEAPVFLSETNLPAAPAQPRPTPPPHKREGACSDNGSYQS